MGKGKTKQDKKQLQISKPSPPLHVMFEEYTELFPQKLWLL